MDTSITYADGGEFNLLIAASDPNPLPINFVEVYIEGVSTGFYLPVLDSMNNLFGFIDFPAEPGIKSDLYLLEYAAISSAGLKSSLFPYLTVEQ